MSNASAISPCRDYPDQMIKKRVFLTHHPSLITHHFPKVIAIQIHNFHGGHRRFITFVGVLLAGARFSLLSSVRGNDAEHRWNAALHTRITDAARRLGRNIIEVRRLSTDNHTEANYGIEISG